MSGFDEMENSRRITSNFLFGNTSSSYDFGLMAQTGIDQSVDNADVSNNNFTFIQATQRSKYEFTLWDNEKFIRAIDFDYEKKNE